MPQSLGEALDALEADSVIGEAVGEDIVNTFLAMKRFEIGRHQAHVSDWDLAEYMHPDDVPPKTPPDGES